MEWKRIAQDLYYMDVTFGRLYKSASSADAPGSIAIAPLSPLTRVTIPERVQAPKSDIGDENEASRPNLFDLPKEEALAMWRQEVEIPSVQHTADPDADSAQNAEDHEA